VNGLYEVGRSAPHQPRVIIKTIINGVTSDGSTTHPMRQTAREALIALMAPRRRPRPRIDHSPQGPGSDLASRSMTGVASQARQACSRQRRPAELSVIAKAEGWSKLTSEARARMVALGGG
jgi:hypothetical protein